MPLAIFSLLASEASEASMGASYFWDRVIGYFCAKGVQHTSDKSGGELVTLFGSCCDDGRSAALKVHYTSDTSFINSMLWGLTERAVTLFSKILLVASTMDKSWTTVFSKILTMYVINYGHLQSQNDEMLSCAHAQMNWFYNLRRVRPVSCGEATLRKNWPSMPGK